jgi:hypothetical protein
MHESLRKFLCRAAVLLGALLPTLFTLIWVLWSQTPFSAHYQAAYWQQQIAQELGLQVEVQAAVSLSPRRYRLRSIEWKHPETQQRIGLADEVYLTPYDQGYLVEIKSLDLEADELTRAMEWLHAHLLCRAATAPKYYRIELQQLRLGQGAIIHSFEDVSLEYKTAAQESAMALRARPMSTELAEKIQLKMERIHDRNEPYTKWNVHSGGNRLSSSLLAAFWFPAAKLGMDAGFIGEIQGEASQRNSVCTVDGRIENLSFDELTRSLPQNLAGKGTLGSLRATIRNEHLVQASGEISIVGGGSLPRQWLVQASYLFGLRLRSEFFEPTSTLVHFDQFLCSFDWDTLGLALRGGMTSRLEAENLVVGGVMAADANGPAFTDAGVAPELLPRANSHQVLQWLTSVPTATGGIQSLEQQELVHALGRYLPFPAVPNASTVPAAYQARQ